MNVRIHPSVTGERRLPFECVALVLQGGGALGSQLESIEREAIVKALEKTRYNKTAAAKLLDRPFDRRHVPGGNWARVAGIRSLNGSTIGIIGFGEIGREIAVRAAAFRASASVMPTQATSGCV